VFHWRERKEILPVSLCFVRFTRRGFNNYRSSRNVAEVFTVVSIQFSTLWVVTFSQRESRRLKIFGPIYHARISVIPNNVM
jgi:hypothetical protein